MTDYTPHWTTGEFREGYAFRIDYNNDNDFNDPGEHIWQKPVSTQTPVGTSFTVPSDAPLGSTRIRISMKYEGVPNSCETFEYGEVEDYTVNIVSPSTSRASGQSNLNVVQKGFQNLKLLKSKDAIAKDGASVEIALHPNPVGPYLIAKLKDSQMKDYVITDFAGKTSSGTLDSSNRINVEKLSAGSYLITFTGNGKKITRQFIKK